MKKKKRSKRKPAAKAVAPVKKKLTPKQIILLAICAAVLLLASVFICKSVFYKKITRAQLSQIISESLSASSDIDLSSFSDVSSSSPYYEGLKTAFQFKLFDVENGLLEPDKLLTNEEAYSMISRAYLLHSNDASSLNYIRDSGDISDKYKYDLSGIVGDGYVDKGKVYPQKKASYKEILEVMKKIEGFVVTSPGQVPEGANLGNLYIKSSGVTMSDTELIGHLIITDVPGASIELSGVKVKGKIIIRSTDTSKVILKNNSSCAGVYAVGTGGGTVECDETSVVKLHSGAHINVNGNVSTMKIENGGYVVMNGNLENATVENFGTISIGSGSFGGIFLYGELSAAVVREDASGDHVAASTSAGGSCIEISGKVTTVSCEAARCSIIATETAQVGDINIYEGSDNSSLRTEEGATVSGTITVEADNVEYRYSGKELDVVVTGENFKKVDSKT